MEFKEIVDQEAVNKVREIFKIGVLFRVLDMSLYIWISKKEAIMLVISKTKLTPEHALALFFMKMLWKIIILKQKEKM